MITSEEKQTTCVCGEVITIRKYEGLEDTWWTDHHCEKLDYDDEEEP